jgi:hypothetical protein
MTAPTPKNVVTDSSGNPIASSLGKAAEDSAGKPIAVDSTDVTVDSDTVTADGRYPNLVIAPVRVSRTWGVAFTLNCAAAARQIKD